MTQGDFEPVEVTSGSNAPGANESPIGTGATGDAGCPFPEGCCTQSDQCPSGQVCMNGSCSSACSNTEDVNACPVLLCPGPGCPDPEESCSDGLRNGRESDVDCGEACPRACGGGDTCNTARDCASLRCEGSRCAAASCGDGVRNQDETGVDCGGSCPTPCGALSPCSRDEDCAPGLFCAEPARRCTDSSCRDGVQAGTEVSIDCGGECPGCPLGSPCNDPEDCESSVCTAGQCSAPSCSDGLASGDETGVDCGGSAPDCPRCADGTSCRSGADCVSGSCQVGVCVSCSDGEQNGSETGADCGGSACPRCPEGEACVVDADCAGGRCDDATCRAPTCADGVLNGGETDTDCGGPDPECPRCDAGSSCSVASDCTSSRCAQFVCVSCSDGVQNGSESDTDCGGPDLTCGRCGSGLGCRADADCASGVCQDGTCCGGVLVDCTRCAERLSTSVSCDSPAAGVDSTGVINCNAFLACLTRNADRCPTRNTPGCSSDDLADACPHNTYGGNAGTGVTRATLVLQDAGCQL